MGRPGGLTIGFEVPIIGIKGKELFKEDSILKPDKKFINKMIGSQADIQPSTKREH